MKLTDFLNSINHTKNNIIRQSDAPAAAEKFYSQFVVSRCLSYFADTILIVNEINARGTSMHHITPKMHYEFLLHAISRKRRFSKWQKPDKNDNIQMIMEIYKYNYDKAKSVLEILSDEDLKMLRQQIDPGGKK